MKRILLLVIMLICFITPCTFAAKENVYENQQYKFKMNIPDNWPITEGYKGLIFRAASPNGGIPSIALGISHLTSTTTASKTFTQENEDKIVTPFIGKFLKSHPNVVLKDKRHIQIANKDAIQVTLNSGNAYLIYYFFINKDFVYIGVAGGILNYLDTDKTIYDQSFSTFTFID